MINSENSNSSIGTTDSSEIVSDSETMSIPTTIELSSDSDSQSESSITKKRRLSNQTNQKPTNKHSAEPFSVEDDRLIQRALAVIEQPSDEQLPNSSIRK